MKKKWMLLPFLFILLLLLLNAFGVFPKEMEMLPGETEPQKITMEVT